MAGKKKVKASAPLARMESMTRPGTFYEIRLTQDGTSAYCSCPAWKYQRLPPRQRTCKHLKAMAAAGRKVAA